MKLTNQRRTASVALGCLLLAVIAITGCKSASEATLAANASTSSPSHETKRVETAIANSLAKWDGTTLKSYDESLVSEIRERWYNLLDGRPTLAKGMIKVEFRLNMEGEITGVKVLEYTAGELAAYLCSQAIKDCGRLPAWSNEMRKEIGQDYRDVSFTFHYH